MRKVKVINVEGRGEVTVKEISPYGLYQAYQSEDKMAQLSAMLNDAVIPGFEEIKTWYPSELQQVVDGFMAVNDSFFAIARTLKVDGLMAEVAKTLRSNLPPLFAESFRQGMAELGDMGGRSL